MEPRQFLPLISTVTGRVAGKPLNAALEMQLNELASPSSATYGAILAGAHCPTGTGGRALILYLLPDGKIEFTT